MKCEECRDLLWIYLEWETTPEESAEIKAHLAECPKCRKAASQHMAVMETLRSLPEAELPEGYHAELMQKIAAAGSLAEETDESDETAILPNHVSTPPVEWKVVRKTEILQKAKAEKEQERKQRHGWKGLSLVAAAVLVVAAVGGINGAMNMRQTPSESVQLTSDLPDEGGAESVQTDTVPENAAAPVTAAGSAEEAGQTRNTDLENMPVMEDTARIMANEAVHTAPKEPAQPEPESTPNPMLRSAPVPETASLSAPPAPPALAKAADGTESAENSISDNGITPDSAAEEKSGDSLKLNPQNNGADVYNSVLQAAENYAGFQESANGSSISVMIPVENLGAFLSELGTIGEIEWQTQGQEEVGATYRRVEILLGTE